MLPSLEPLCPWRRLTFGWRERLRGDIEKTYTKQEWKQFFEQAAFRLDFVERFLSTTLKERMANALKHKILDPGSVSGMTTSYKLKAISYKLV